MIRRFGAETALLLVDVQQGVDALAYWGGPNARRNNPDAEAAMRRLLDGWRQQALPVAFTLHDSREAASPLKLSQPGGRLKEGFEPREDDITVRKDVNSGFIGTNLELALRRRGVNRLVVAGFFTNMCVETTVRMAGNLGFDTYLVPEGCACTNRLAPDGTDFDPDLIHRTTVANLHGEFCTAIASADALALLVDDRADMERVQGNE
ncbi:MAG: isochorismatase family protein [Alphaproteobacteria bacterium]|nr:isochorismatase family protein [Alphaproteobacteria bacterium]